MRITITEEHTGGRLDKVLQAILVEKSRSAIQQAIERGLVRVNGKTVKKHHMVRVGDVIDVEDAPKVVHHEHVAVPDPHILVEADEYLVLDKPTGMLVHPTIRNETGTLVDFLLKKYPKIRHIGDDPQRPGIVHRLDKDASGIMVVPKTQQAFDVLKKQFLLREVKKRYKILVYGAVTPLEGVIQAPLSRSKQNRTRIAAGSKAGRVAITQYWVEKQFKGYSLVRVEPQTGRTHQIRVHFLSKGHPVVGDALYVSRNVKKTLSVRLMLHAEMLGFKDVSGVYHEYECPPDVDFQGIISKLE